MAHQQGFEQAEQKETVCLVFFTTEATKSLLDKFKLEKDGDDILRELSYIMIVLKTDKKDKDKDDLNVIKKLLNPKENPKKEGDAEPSEPIKKEIELGVKYKITSPPHLLWTDCYGNELQKVSSAVLSAKDTGLLRTEAQAMIKKAQKSREDLVKSYEPLGKQFEKEKQGQKFSSTLIGDLQKIAAYSGYEPCKKAKSNLEEINTGAEEELNKVLDDSKARNGDEETLIKNLVSIENKYKGLPVAKKSKEIREKMEKEQKPKTK